MDAIERVSDFKFPDIHTESSVKKESSKKLFSFDNFAGDKGVIIADSLEEAKELYKAKYPKRKIAKDGNDDETYFDNGCYILEEDVMDDTSKLLITCPW